MRFSRLSVRNFRGVDAADLELGPGLNVCFGPNDLGKTTLVTALRAALLLPAESTAHRQYLAWHHQRLPEVSLSLELGGQWFRIEKRFGTGGEARSRLEVSSDGQSFRDAERGRAVDRRLREVLRWGIEAPGGRSGSRGVPESFLSQVLLASQASVPTILERDLSIDRDDSGHQRLHEAFQSLAQDPELARVLEAAQQKVDEAFTPTGRRRSGRTSPFAALRQRVAELMTQSEELSRQRAQSEDLRVRIASLSQARAERAQAIAQLREHLGELEQLGEVERQRAELHRQWEQASRQVSALEAQHAEAARCAAEREAASEHSEARAEAAAEAHRALEEAGRLEAAAERAQLALQSEPAQERAERAELDRRRREFEAMERQVERWRECRSAVERERGTQRELQSQRSRLGGELTEHETARLKLAKERDHRQSLLSLGRLREASAAVQRAVAARAEETELERQAAELDAEAEREQAETGVLDRLSADSLADLRRLQSEWRVAEARLAVGLSVEVRASLDLPVQVQADGEPCSRSSDASHFTARSRVAVRVPGVVELEAIGGDPEHVSRAEVLRERWQREALPVLEREALHDVEALAARWEVARARRAAAERHRERAQALRSRAEQLRALGAQLPELERLRAERRDALPAGDEPAARDQPALGAGWELEVERGLEQTRRALDEVGAQATRVAAESAAVDQRLLALSEDMRRRTDAEREALARVAAALELQSVDADAVESRRHELAEGLKLLDERVRASAGERAAQSEHLREALDKARQGHAEAERHARSAQSDAIEAREAFVAIAAEHRQRTQRLAELPLAPARDKAAALTRSLAALAPPPAELSSSLAGARRQLSSLEAEQEQLRGELARAEGALGQVGGDVVDERLRRNTEALDRARALDREQQLDYDAYALLARTLRAVEQEQGAHLGKALEVPVGDLLSSATEGRYDRVGLGTGLGTSGIFVAGSTRSHAELSQGTQEQLATLLRLCIAEYLGSAIVLDDHLAQTHRERAAWFRDHLRELSRKIQIVVVTARPEDYLRLEETPVDVAVLESPDACLRAVNLERVIQRARYAAEPNAERRDAS